MKAIEVMGTINDQGQLSLDEPLVVGKSSRVRVIVLFSEEQEIDEDEDELESAVESFRQGWYEAMTGKTLPVSQLWEGIDAD
jgi:hypothetical protein